jgi:hypothetical protein
MSRKKTICICFYFILIAIRSGDCIDREQWGGNLGFSYWYPEWSNGLSNFDSSTAGLYGPAFFIHVKNWGIGLQYFTGEFDLIFPGSSQAISADRTDMDIMLSCRIAKYFQLSALYKNIEFDWKQTYKVRSHLSGFGFGGGVNHVFPQKILCYGFGFYMPTLDYRQAISGGDDVSGNADGYWLEGGIGYIITHPGLILRLGYRYQRLSIEADILDWIEDTDGVRADITYYF